MQDVVDEAVRATKQAIRSTAIQQRWAGQQRGIVALATRTVAAVMTRWANAGLQEGGSQERNVAERDCRRKLYIPWMVVGPLDKGRHRVRYVCPKRAWEELRAAANEFCEWGPMVGTPEATQWQKD